MGIQQIDAVRASQLITSFIQHPQLGAGQSNVIGGLIRIEDLELKSYNHLEQILTVYHYYISEEICPILCSAFSITGATEAIKAIELFSLDGEANDLRVLSFLHRQSGLSNASSEKIPIFQVTQYGNNLIEKFQRIGVRIDAQAHTFISRTDNSLHDLIYQPSIEAKYIRFFYGYSKYNTSQLRVILSPVDDRGRNILVLPNGKSATWLELGRQ